MVTYQGNALCQAVKLEGLSSGSERRLEDRFRHLLEHNGPEFVVDTLKVLKQHCIDNLDGPLPYSQDRYGYPYVSWNKHKDRPRGGLGVIYTEFKDPRKRLRVIGAVINTIELDQPTEKQVERFRTGVEYNNRTDSSVVAQVSTMEKFRLADKLAGALWRAKPYSGTDLTGSVIPEGLEQKGIAKFVKTLSDHRKHDPDERSLAIANMEEAFTNQCYLAPKPVHDYVRDHIIPRAREAAYGSKFAYLKRPTPIKARPYDGNTKFGLHIEDYRPYVGTISMLQQPGAKLRTVVNVNRYVNYAMDPFAKALEDAFYGEPQISVLDQESGMRWAQDQLKAGRRLASVDLSQATDLLDFRVLTRALRYDDPKWEKEVDLNATLELFSYIAESPFYQPDLQVGVTMNTGQPLGLKGSFQMLTVMNYLAGRQACLDVGLKDLPFRVVGDDMIIDDRAAERYSEIVTSWSGKTNYEKMLSSDRYAEFCSHIITRDSITSMKPHYIAGYTNVYRNAQKTSYERISKVYRLTEQDKTNLLALAQAGNYSVKNIPYVKHSSKMKFDDQLIVSIAKGLYTSLGKSEGSDKVTVSPQSVDLALQDHPEVYSRKRRELDRSRYIRSTDGAKIMLSPSTISDENRKFNPQVDRYNHHTGQRDVVRKHTLKSDREDAQVVAKIVKDLRDGVPSELKIPHHDRTVSTTGLLVEAIRVHEHGKLVNKVDQETSNAIISNEIPGLNPKSKSSLSDDQMKKRLEQTMLHVGLKSHDVDLDVDYSSYLP